METSAFIDADSQATATVVAVHLTDFASLAAGTRPDQSHCDQAAKHRERLKAKRIEQERRLQGQIVMPDDGMPGATAGKLHGSGAGDRLARALLQQGGTRRVVPMPEFETDASLTA
jgi:hypothetical protein